MILMVMHCPLQDFTMEDLQRALRIAFKLQEQEQAAAAAAAAASARLTRAATSAAKAAPAKVTPCEDEFQQVRERVGKTAAIAGAAAAAAAHLCSSAISTAFFSPRCRLAGAEARAASTAPAPTTTRRCPRPTASSTSTPSTCCRCGLSKATQHEGGSTMHSHNSLSHSYCWSRPVLAARAPAPA